MPNSGNSAMKLVAVRDPSDPDKLVFDGLPCLDECLGPPDPNTGQGAWPRQRYRLDETGRYAGLRQDLEERAYMTGLTNPDAPTDLATTASPGNKLRKQGLTACYWCMPCYDGEGNPRLDLPASYVLLSSLSVDVWESDDLPCSLFNRSGTLVYGGITSELFLGVPWEQCGNAPDESENWRQVAYWAGESGSGLIEVCEPDVTTEINWIMEVCVWCLKTYESGTSGPCGYTYKLGITYYRSIPETGCYENFVGCCFLEPPFYYPGSTCANYFGWFDIAAEDICSPSGEFVLDCLDSPDPGPCSITVTLGAP